MMYREMTKMTKGKESKGCLEKILAISEGLLRPNMKRVSEDGFVTIGRTLVRDAEEAYLITLIPFIPVNGATSATQYGLLAIRNEGRTADDFTLLTMINSSKPPYIYEKEICRQIGIYDVLEPEVYGGQIWGLGKEQEKRVYKIR